MPASPGTGTLELIIGEKKSLGSVVFNTIEASGSLRSPSNVHSFTDGLRCETWTEARLLTSLCFVFVCFFSLLLLLFSFLNYLSVQLTPNRKVSDTSPPPHTLSQLFSPVTSRELANLASEQLNLVRTLTSPLG